MNILLVTNQLCIGGAEQFVVRLANELVRRYHHVVLVSAGGDLEAMVHPKVVRVTARAQAKGPWGLKRLSESLTELIDLHGIQVVHANSPTTALAASFACWHRPIPVITSAHGSWEDRVKPFVARLFSLGSDRVVGVSRELTADLVRHGLSPHKAETIHNGIPYRPLAPDPELRLAVRRELGLKARTPVIITVGRLAKDKGHAFLLGAMPSLLRALPEAKLLLVGHGECHCELQGLAQALEITHAVQFLGFRDDVERLLVAADVFCLPSEYEGLPLAVAEAMAAGLPVVSTPVGGIPEIVADGVSGYLVPYGTSEPLSERLIEILGDQGLARGLGLAGKETIAERFTLEGMVSRFESLYEQQVYQRTLGFMQRAMLG